MEAKKWPVIIVATVLLGLLNTTAGASVIYRWHTISATEYIDPLNGMLEITDAAWLSGSLDYSYNGGRSAPSGGFTNDPDSPIISSEFSVGVPAVSVAGRGPIDINIYPRTGESNHTPWYLDAILSFDHQSGLLSGSLYANNQESDYRVNSDASDWLWTITHFNSDRLAGAGGCYSGSSSGCSGATGFWVIDPSTVPVLVSVPGPDSLPLVSFGLLLLLGAILRRRRGHAKHVASMRAPEPVLAGGTS